jgi:WD40 repeat protein
MSDVEDAAPVKGRRGGGDEEEDTKGGHRVRVAVRIRPFNRADHDDRQICLSVEENKITADNGSKSASFTYDFVFHMCGQSDVYKKIGETMLHDAFGGYNSTIFAYGQTGSGKTYSMVGVEDDPEHEGLLPRICKDLFELSGELQAEDPTLICKIQVSFVEVYNEKIHDLLQFEGSGQNPDHMTSDDLKELKLKEDKKHKCFYVDKLSLHTVVNYPRVKNLIEVGTKLRTKAETGMNELSSRSHSVFCIYMSQTHEPPNALHRDTSSKLTIVDLAGSERQSKTDIGTDAKRLKEAERINMSLLILGRCLSACSEGQKGHIPLRESVLTKMLMDIFGGNSKTMMFATVSPSMFNFAETMSTLQYAYNAKKIKNKAKVNTMAKAIEVKELKEQVKALGKTLIEELEKAAQQKELLDREIEAINQEKALITSALKTCQEENEELKLQLEELKNENKELKNALGTGQFSAAAAAALGTARLGEDGTARGEGEFFHPGAPGSTARVPGESGTWQRQAGDGDSEEEDLEKEHKLAEIHAELTRKLHLINPVLVNSGQGTMRGGPQQSAREQMLSGTARVTGLMSSHEIRSYIGHAAAVYCCAFSPSGEKMVSASRDRTLKIWSVKSGSELATLKGHNGFVLSCAYSPSGNEIISTSDDKTAKVWDANSGKKLWTLKGHNDKVYCCVYSPKGTEIATASCDKTVKVWSAETGKKIITLRKHSSAVFSCSFSFDGVKLVSASDDKTVRVWNWREEKELVICQGHTGTVWSCDFNSTADQILSASMDGTIKLWDANTGDLLKTYRGHSAPVHHAIFAKDGARIISSSRDRTMKVWNTETCEVESTLIGHTNTVYHCCVHNNLILSCSSDDILKVWNLKVKV